MKILSLTAALMLSLSAGALLAQDKPGQGVTVRPVMQPYIEEMFQVRIISRALEDLGYTVDKPQEVLPQTAHLAVGTGDVDFFANSWDLLHDTYFQEAGGAERATKVGVLADGAVQGYLVDKASYDAGVKSLADLKDPELAARFDADGDGKADLAGCMPGWGCEIIIEHQLDALGLRDTVTHNQGEYNAIIADILARHKAGKGVLYYTWTPYWVSGALVPGKDVEWLSVPDSAVSDDAKGHTEFQGKSMGFAVDREHIMANNAFLKANPAAAKLFEVIKIPINDISAENNMIAAGENKPADVERHVDDWIKAHQAEYDSWLETARAAAK